MKLPKLGLGKAVIIAFLSLPASVAILIIGIVLSVIASLNGSQSPVFAAMGVYGMVFCWIIGIGAIAYSLIQKGINALNE